MEQVVAESHVVPLDAGRQRLDVIAHRAFEAYPTKSSAKKACKRGEIALDGQVTEGSRFVEVGQRVDRLYPEAESAISFYEREIEVLFEDEYLAIVFKPPGLRVNGNQAKTLERALPFNLRTSQQPDAIVPRVCHRLDAKTSGLVAVAKTRRALGGVSQAFMDRRVDKRYRALLVGRIDGEGIETADVDERTAHTTWRAVRHSRALKGDWMTTVDLIPRTGRRHQLRVHMAGLGHPVLGDLPYGLEGLILFGKGLFLCAVRLAFAHPITGEALAIEASEPAKFEIVRAREARRWLKYHEPDAGSQ